MCVYCSQLFSKLSKHLERKHRAEVEVVKAFSFPKFSKERKQALKTLMNRGDFIHNSSVMTSSVMEQPKSTTEDIRRHSVVKTPWTDEEIQAVEKHLGKYFRIPQLPGKAECTDTLKKEPVLHRRTWSHIKFFIKNRKTKFLKTQS